MRKAQAEAARRQAKRRRVITWLGGLVILALVAAIVVAVLRAASSGSEDTATGAAVVPVNVTSDGAIPVGQADAPVTVDIYYDYMCPACGAFEQVNGSDLEQLVDDGTIQIRLRPISFLDRTSMGTEYSTRTANAITTVAAEAPDRVWAFHRALYANQPEEGTSGLDDDEIAALASEAGVPDAVVKSFTQRTYDGWVAKVTEDAFTDGVEGTPTVKVNGKLFEGDWSSPNALRQAIGDAVGSNR